MSRIFGLFSAFTLIFFSACATSPKPAADKVYHSAVIFIPGYKGSVLREDGTNETVWLTTSEILFGSRSLSLLGEEAGITNRVPVHSDGLFKSFLVVPWVYRYSVYDNWVDFLRTHVPSDCKVVEFGYDWRIDNFENAERLSDVIKGLEQSGISNISAVSHSMGGIILSYYLRYGAQRPDAASETWEGAKHLRRVVFAGAPFRGSITILRDLEHGNPTITNDELISRDAIGTFFSSYQLLPLLSESPFLGVDGKPAHEDLSDPAVWDRFDWGFLGNAASPEIRRRRLDALRTRLGRATQIETLINRAPSAETRVAATDPGRAPRYLAISGNLRATAAHALLDESQQHPVLEFASDEPKKRSEGFNPKMLFEDGDGLVTVESSAVPPAYRERMQGETLYRHIEHGEFFNDDEIRTRVMDFLFSDDERAPDAKGVQCRSEAGPGES